MPQTLADISVYLANKQPEILNSMLEATPIINSMPVRPASHGFKNVYDKVTDIKGPQEVLRDDELPTVSISTKLEETTLGKIGGMLPILKDTAKAVGGYGAYVNTRIPSIVQKGAMANEQRIYYDGLVASAIANGQAFSCGGTTANSQYSMVAVHWDYASTVGLFNPNAVSNGKLFEQYFLYNGAEGLIPVTENGVTKNIVGKVFAIEMEFGLQLADQRSCAAILNIEPSEDTADPDKITGLPTPKKMTDLLAAVRATPGSTVIYAHPTIIALLAAKYQLSKRIVQNGENTVRYELTEWRGIPMVGSYNIYDGSEDVVSVA